MSAIPGSGAIRSTFGAAHIRSRATARATPTRTARAAILVRSSAAGPASSCSQQCASGGIATGCCRRPMTGSRTHAHRRGAGALKRLGDGDWPPATLIEAIFETVPRRARPYRVTPQESDRSGPTASCERPKDVGDGGRRHFPGGGRPRSRNWRRAGRDHLECRHLLRGGCGTQRRQVEAAASVPSQAPQEAPSVGREASAIRRSSTSDSLRVRPLRGSRSRHHDL